MISIIKSIYSFKTIRYHIKKVSSLEDTYSILRTRIKGKIERLIMKKFIIQLFSRPQNKNCCAMFYYYFFIIFYPIGVLDGLFNLSTNVDDQNINTLIAFSLYLILVPIVFRFSTIVSFFRERELNTNNTVPKQISYIKVIISIYRSMRLCIIASF